METPGWIVCPECDGAAWNPACTLCHGAGILDYETDDDPDEGRAPVCPECGFPLYVRDESSGRGAATYCDECGKVTDG